MIITQRQDKYEWHVGGCYFWKDSLNFTIYLSWLSISNSTLNIDTDISDNVRKVSINLRLRLSIILIYQKKKKKSPHAVKLKKKVTTRNAHKVKLSHKSIAWERNYRRKHSFAESASLDYITCESLYHILTDS